jgi:hypothetical protein
MMDEDSGMAIPLFGYWFQGGDEEECSDSSYLSYPKRAVTGIANKIFNRAPEFH